MRPSVQGLLWNLSASSGRKNIGACGLMNRSEGIVEAFTEAAQFNTCAETEPHEAQGEDPGSKSHTHHGHWECPKKFVVSFCQLEAGVKIEIACSLKGADTPYLYTNTELKQWFY